MELLGVHVDLRLVCQWYKHIPCQEEGEPAPCCKKLNIYFVSRKCDLNLQGIIKGGKGVTKTWSVEVIMWQLTGQKPEDKLDPGSRDTTVKRLAAYYSTPTVIEDNASKRKVEKLPSYYCLIQS